MCSVCIYAERDADGGANVCGVTGRPLVQLLISGQPCPKGYHPRDGIVRWLGIRWYGVPMPVRLWLWATHAKHPRPGRFTGCGCIVRLKDWWTQVRTTRRAREREASRAAAV